MTKYINKTNEEELDEFEHIIKKAKEIRDRK